MLEIILDVREHALIEKLNTLSTASPSTLSVKTEQLLLGDVAIRATTLGVANENRRLSSQPTEDILLFERKSLTDLLASIKDGRYEEQSHRLIHTAGVHPHNIIYVIEGVFNTLRNPADKKVILSAMTSLSYFKGFSVFRTASVQDTAELVWGMANKLDKEFEKGREVPAYLRRAYSSGGQSASSSSSNNDTFSSATDTEGANVKTQALRKAGSQRLRALCALCVAPENFPPATPSGAPEVDRIASQQINLELGESNSNGSVERMPTTESYSSFVKKAKRDNITPENIGEILLCQIPGISTTVAQAILKQYDGSFSKLLEGIKTDPDKLETIYTETNGKRRRISSAVIQAILNYLTR